MDANTPTIPTRLTTALHDLGSTPDAVAFTLEQADITGRPRSGAHCPITRWMRCEVPEVAHLFRCLAEGPWLWITPAFLEGVLPDGQRVEIPIPIPVGDFIDAFDRGGFPWLVEKPAAVAA